MSKSFLLGNFRQSWNLLLLAALATVIMPLANCIIIIIKKTGHLYQSKKHFSKRVFLKIKEIYQLNYSLKKIKSDQPLSYVWSDNWYKI